MVEGEEVEEMEMALNPALECPEVFLEEVTP